MKYELNFHENFDSYSPFDEFMFKVGFSKNIFGEIHFFTRSTPTYLFPFTKSEQNILLTYYLKTFLWR